MDTMNKLQNGKYYIMNRACGTRVGLVPMDPGFKGYAIVREERHLEHHELPYVTFTLTHKKDELYELKIEGDFVIGRNGAVFAPPKGGEQLWKIVYREGNKAYT
ncbi:hypothetical protein H0H81_004095 [Sphagnurus paluster]|uniref:Uncharacterized protein n=1 Tax=Sphagnurus paluster TaxID=117069 RepID=A0A9P7K664_9AGAR|nr:hypothetical protein H0H81_004095 [Sphagnurus paluster]